MLGIYISGHPLEKYKEQIKKLATIDTLKMKQMQEIGEEGIESSKMDGKIVTFPGIITSVKKKYTKNNTLMAFVTVEDLYGSCEIIVFDSCYARSNSSLFEENIVVVDGRLSVREDEDIKIVANNISTLQEDTPKQQQVQTKPKLLSLNIENATEEQKAKLRGTLRFFKGNKNNIAVEVVDNGEHKPCGTIYLNEEILEQFKEILGEEGVVLK